MPRVEIPGYRIRPLSFVASAGLHGSVILTLAMISPHNGIPRRTAYDEIIRPQEHKLIWYNFQRKLPDVVPDKKTGASGELRGIELSKQAMIAMSPNAKSEKQFIWRPVPKIEIPKDLPLPNLIARVNMALPPPPQPEIKKKLERPAADGVRAAQPNASPPDPKGDVNHALQPRKAFVPPPQAKQQVRLSASIPDTPLPDASIARTAVPEGLGALKPRKAFVAPFQPAPQAGAPVGVLDVPPPDPSFAGVSKTRSDLPEGLGTPSLSKGWAPPLNAPVGPVAANGNANVDLAIAGLNAADGLSGPLPEGARPGRFSKAPAIGEPAGGGGAGGSGALTVPDLSVREDRSKSLQPSEMDAKRKTILYAETVRNIPVATLSVPLRPSSRTIPSSIDARFQGRSVYTMVVPIENLPAYGGDWIIWFAERGQQPGDASSMRAPVPFRKLEPADSVLSGNRTERRLQITAVLRKDGRLDGISLVRRVSAAVEQVVNQDLTSWEFKPATRGGIPVDVDVVIEIPFNLTAEVASTETK